MTLPSASGNLFESIDFSSWNHSIDGEFLSNLTFNERSESVLSGFKAHSKGKNWQKHSAPRSGGDPENGRYRQSQNKQKGSKNKKYIVPTNPNKRLK